MSLCPNGMGQTRARYERHTFAVSNYVGCLMELLERQGVRSHLRVPAEHSAENSEFTLAIEDICLIVEAMRRSEGKPREERIENLQSALSQCNLPKVRQLSPETIADSCG